MNEAMLNEALRERSNYSEMLRREQDKPRAQRMPLYEAYLELGVNVAQRAIDRYKAQGKAA